MKKQISVGRMNSRSFVLAGFAAIALFLVSCEKAEDDFMAEEISAMQEESALKGAPAPGNKSIAQIAIENDFTALVGALQFVDAELGTNLVEMFSTRSGQYTVFAPTNQAFQELTDALIDVGAINSSLTELGAETIRDVLFYHVTEGRRASNSVVPKVRTRTIQTLLGKSFTVDTKGNITAIGNSATITAADFSASNGIVHVINAVILPF
jgi:uncharacterized surface protein with fasciclin (FAS1) repeats